MFGFICGLFVGAWFGMFIYALIIASKDDKE